MEWSTYLLASLLAFVATAHGQGLPYNPTRILLSPDNPSAYIFQPSTQYAGQSQLLALDTSSPLSTSHYPFTTISKTLPFLDDTELRAYTPTIDPDGNITVIAGNCAQGANTTQIWRFAVDGDSSGNRTWAQHHTSDQGVGTLTGSNYLASGVAFSEYVDGNATDVQVFLFGGMCPFSNSTADTWTSAAAYSNQMLSISPNAGVGGVDYNISLTASRGPPIAEAGSSITPLAPTYSANVSGQAQTQQQNFVLLGGHTQGAFINMSQLALFSLPQESWTFLSVAAPSGARTDLATRQASAAIEPRSGHTAILAEDGNSVIVFGGWVGDVNTPAQPQLAVLQLGSGYGGSGVWSWTVPTQSGPGLVAGAGVYGHGAAMLPGGVMMVVGGYAVSAPSSQRVKRESQTTNTQIYLYNTTSSTWLSSYTPPPVLAQAGGAGSQAKKSQQIGLGTGLSIGAVVLILLLAFYLWYNNRLRRARDTRDRALLSHSSDASFLHSNQPFLNNGGIDGRGGDAASVGRFWGVWDSSSGTYPVRPPQMQEQARVAGSTGLFVNAPSPTRGLRKGVANKNYTYHAAPRYDDQRTNQGSGDIHPIAEREDEDDSMISRGRESMTDDERKLKELERVLSAPPYVDWEPNPLGSHPPASRPIEAPTIRRVTTKISRTPLSPTRTPSHKQIDELKWTAERASSEPLLPKDPGQALLARADERATPSEPPTSNINRGSSITRTMSTRTGTLLAAAAAARMASNTSPELGSSDERTRTMSSNDGRKSPFYCHLRPQASIEGSVSEGPPNSAGSSTEAESFTTAKTDFAELQSRGEALLNGREVVDRDNPYQRAIAANRPPRDIVVITNNNGRPQATVFPRRQQGWMGSLRRALGAVSQRSISFTNASEQNGDEAESTASSPTKTRRLSSSGPRRTVSDGGAVFRQKRGQKDWEEDQWPRYKDDPDPGDWGERTRSSLERQQAEGDWDVEGAASKRDVQITFTVPKARLRVVNADMDRASLRSASDGALSRDNSVKTLKREASVRTLKARPESEQMRLHTTMEEVVDEEFAEDYLVWEEKEKEL